MCISDETQRLTNIRPRVLVADPIDTSRVNPDSSYNEIHDQEFVQGSLTSAGLGFLGHVMSPPPETQDQEFLQGSSTGARFGPVFLGRIDLCTPSPSP